MKQEVSPTATSDSSKHKPLKPAKAEKNLYEPYSTPPVLWSTIRLLLRFLFSMAARIRLRGRYNLPTSGPFIIASNHLSWFDVPIIPAFMHRKVIAMAKEELFKSKIGWLVRFLGAFPVKRGEGDRQSIRAAEQQLKQGNLLLIFPEGTRSKAHTLAKGHAGLGMIALRSGAPIVPVAVWGTEKMLKTFRPYVTISFGEPIILQPKGNKITREDIDEATGTIMRKIAAMLPSEYRGVYEEETMLDKSKGMDNSGK